MIEMLKREREQDEIKMSKCKETRNKGRKMTRPIRDDRGGKMKQGTQKKKNDDRKVKERKRTR